MRKGILCLAGVALLALFSTSCKPDVIITTPDKIEIELGSTDADVLKGVEANTGDEVTVTGVNYDHAGEQTATFAAGDVTLDKVIYVKTDKLAGAYTYQQTIGTVVDDEIYSCTITQSTTTYNKIIVGGLIGGVVEGSALCQGQTFTLESFNMEHPELGKASVTGTGTFEKTENNIYQVNTAEITIDFENEGVESWVISIEFTKQ